MHGAMRSTGRGWLGCILLRVWLVGLTSCMVAIFSTTHSISSTSPPDNLGMSMSQPFLAQKQEIGTQKNLSEDERKSDEQKLSSVEVLPLVKKAPRHRGFDETMKEQLKKNTLDLRSQARSNNPKIDLRSTPSLRATSLNIHSGSPFEKKRDEAPSHENDQGTSLGARQFVDTLNVNVLRDDGLEFSKKGTEKKEKHLEENDDQAPIDTHQWQDVATSHRAHAPKILISIISSRKEFKSRVGGIANSWGKKLPPSVTLVYLVGGVSDLVDESPGSLADITLLASAAALPSTSSIIVMKDVVDEEYPPILKSAAMMEHLAQIVKEKNFDWILIADDDTFVYTEALLTFLDDKDSINPQLYGQRGTGRFEDQEGLRKVGLKKPYCMGGPGYIMSRDTLLLTADGMGKAITEVDQSEWRDTAWHSDVMIGLSVYRETGLGCWEGGENDYKGEHLFQHNLRWKHPKSIKKFVKHIDFSNTITAHPFKNEMEYVTSWAVA